MPNYVPLRPLSDPACRETFHAVETGHAPSPGRRFFVGTETRHAASLQRGGGKFFFVFFIFFLAY